MSGCRSNATAGESQITSACTPNTAAAIGVYLAAMVSHQAMVALGFVLTAASLAAVVLYTTRSKTL